MFKSACAQARHIKRKMAKNTEKSIVTLGVIS
jgi:hypothetical protein